MTESKMKWALYLCISSYFPENHILEDVNKCVIALQEGDVDTLDRTAGAIRGRAARVIHIINAEMENYETGVFYLYWLEGNDVQTSHKVCFILLYYLYVKVPHKLWYCNMWEWMAQFWAKKN